MNTTIDNCEMFSIKKDEDKYTITFKGKENKLTSFEKLKRIFNTLTNQNNLVFEVKMNESDFNNLKKIY